LTSLRAISDRRIVCVFGCGGDRDKSKRPLMGEIAGSLSDLAILTSDNPRSEKPLDIIDQIVPGIRKVCSRQYQPAAVLNGYKDRGFVVEPDRRAALRLGIAAAGPHEIVLIAGKGHENYQILADRTIHFDDREEALIALSGAKVSTTAESNPNPTKNKADAGPRPPMDWSVDDCLRAARGELLGNSQAVRFGGICIDSRQISGHDLFVAIKGEVHDGHRFAAEVVQKGVRGLMVARDRLADLPWQDWVRDGIVCISVADTTRALGDLAAYHRRRNRVSVAAITGSNGKTTTRQMTAAVVSRRYRTLSTRKNFNNDIGLPLTLFELSPDHQWAVVELGMNAPGEIRRLAEICYPNIGVITNIGPAHLAGVGSIEGVMKAKGELLEILAPEATAVLNADDKRVTALAARTDARIVTYGITEKAQVRATDVSETARGSRFTLRLARERIPIDLNIPGRFMIANALAAAAVGHIIDLPVEEIKTGLERFEPIGGRMNVVDMPNGIHIIDDTYNANPGSMQAALATLQALCKGHRSVFVAGDMKELGTHSQSLHREIGTLAARSGIARILAVGEFAGEVASAAVAEGMPSGNIMTGSKQDILKALRDFLQAGDWVLVKGSRGMTMEEIVQGLKAWAANEY
jgi:UDP-N-acetylmuramoyl-tripeptide--D-alanyl-D-alanine ligase